jgi:sugar phosphate isomerase/epimerase
MKPIALQLYTLREEVYPGGNNLPQVLRTVAKIGYIGVEPAGLHGHDPKEIARIAGDLGLTVCGSHCEMPTSENVAKIAETELTLGNKRVISGLEPEDFQTKDACKQAADKFRQAAELLKPYGLQFGFHNHWWEFGSFDGKYIYDMLLAESPDVFSELDVYWCTFAKADPVKVIDEHKSRIQLLHIKDGDLQPDNFTMTAVGSGAVDIPRIIKAADAADNIEWLLVELDNSATDMLEAVKQSYAYLTSNNLARGKK